MIKPGDLMGNYVTVNNPKHHPKLKGVILEVTGIIKTIRREKPSYSVWLEHINQDKNKYYQTYSQFIEFIEPVPLTEQWLKDFGFKECENFQFRIKLDGIKRGLVISVKWSKSFLDNVYLNQLTEIKYVHQLQNLFYCLTGKELTKQ